MALSDEEFEAWLSGLQIKALNPFTLMTEVDLAKSCECGSDSVGSARHAHYCPKYE